MVKVGVNRDALISVNQGEGVKLTARNTVLELHSDAERVGAGVQGPPGRSLVYNWDGPRLGVGYEGEPLEYRDLGRAYGAGGWALWRDTAYSEARPLEIDTAASGSAGALGGAALLSITPEANFEHAPIDAVRWFDGMTFTPTNVGEAYLLRLSLTALPLVAERELAVSLVVPDFFTVWGEQAKASRGAGVAQRLTFTGVVYALETFVREGGVFAVETDGPLELFDLSVLIVRLVE